MSSKEDSLLNWNIVSIKLLGQHTIRPFLKSHQVKDEHCSICRNSFDENSLNNKYVEKRDNIAIGKCGHCFHKCCIDNWLKEQPTCPICATKWEFLIVDDMSGIKEKLGLPPLSPIVHSSPEQKVSDLEAWGSLELEGKVDEFEGAWGSAEPAVESKLDENSGEIEESQGQQQLSQQQEQEIPGWGSEVESDTDDDMPELVE